MNSILELVTKQPAVQRKNLEQKKQSVELTENLDNNPIARLKAIRDQKKLLAEEEKRICDRLKEKAPQFGFRTSSSTLLLKIGEWGATVRTVVVSYVDEKKVYAYCKRHGLELPRRRVVSYEFDEEAYNALEIPDKIRERLTTDKSYQTITPAKQKSKK